MVDFTSQYIDIDDIYVDPNRQRKEFVEIEELAKSINALGLIQPIVVCKFDSPDPSFKYKIIAGERRYRAHKYLARETIFAQVFENLSELAQYKIEFAENSKRKDLTWVEQMRAVDTYQKLANEKLAQVAQALGLTVYVVQASLRVIKVLDDPQVPVETKERIMRSDSLNGADRIAGDCQNRKATDIIDEIDVSISSAFIEKSNNDIKTSTEERVIKSDGLAPIKNKLIIEPVENKNLISNQSFIDWADAYEGTPRYNFLHCDFPYGINFDKIKVGTKDAFENYDDSPEVFTNLCEALKRNINKFLYTSSHIIFWYSAEWETYVRTLLTDLDFTVYKHPLIWHKSDNKGISSDPNKRPKHVYETALFAYRGSAYLNNTIGDCYSAPMGDARDHKSAKSIPMLQYFMKAFVSSHTKMLDPTAGSGSSLIAALRTGASLVEGLELSETICTKANQDIRIEKTKMALSNALEKQDGNF